MNTTPATAALAPTFGRMVASDDYTEHQRIELHGFSITDATHGRRRINNSAPERELIWVGTYGEGRWMRPEEVLELAAALENVTHAHIDRLAKDQLARLNAAPVYTHHQYRDGTTVRSLESSDEAGNKLRLQTPHCTAPKYPQEKPGVWHGSETRVDAQGRSWMSPLANNYVMNDFGTLVAVAA